MGYQSVNLQSGHFSDLNASIPYPVWLQVELPATSLFHLAPVFSLKVPRFFLSLSCLLFKQQNCVHAKIRIFINFIPAIDIAMVMNYGCSVYVNTITDRK